MAKTKTAARTKPKAQTPAKPAPGKVENRPQPDCTPLPAVEPWRPVFETVTTVGGRVMSPDQYAALVRAATNMMPLSYGDGPTPPLQQAAHDFLLAELTGVRCQDPARPTCCETGTCEPPVETCCTPDGRTEGPGTPGHRPEDFGAEGEQS